MFRAHCSHTSTNPKTSVHSVTADPSQFLLSFALKTQIPKIPKRFVVFANNGNGLEQDSNSKERVEEKGKDEGTGFDGGGGDDDLGKNQRPLFGNITWGDPLPDPDPNNVLAIGLTGLLTWVSVQVLSIALAILCCCCHYRKCLVVELLLGYASWRRHNTRPLHPSLNSLCNLG
ncbi:hypothetical protein C1H46_029238 [Malus baccata]|uniref:Uncharacterized protein n=1 Tax=Malus baccata TaxID=106549 RepID=A0A540LFI1_MALBA|nr:hypothetical protein C1H46_029238 [Malus baccata]